jgi:GT2 family glycosyltransferase
LKIADRMPDISALLPCHPGDRKLTAEFVEALHDQTDPDFNEAAYLSTYPDIADAVQHGVLKSGLAHYIICGKSERRLELAQYRQNLNAQLKVPDRSDASSAAVQAAAVSVDVVIVSESGAVFVAGWTDDRHNPLVAMTLRISQGARHSWTAFPRLRRRDVEATLHSTGGYHHGFWAFAGADGQPGPRPSSRGTACALELCYGNGDVVEMNRSLGVVPDTELRDTVMGYLAACEYWGNPSIEAFGSLDDGAGDALIGFSRSISRGFASQALMERFGQTQRRPKVSIIVPIYGIGDYFMLQSAAYSQGRDIAAYEFIYVVNSPELLEPLCREARIVQMIYGLAQTLVVLPGNAGFGTANNIAIRFARGDRLLFLNPDVFPCDPDWARRHLDALANLPEAQTRLFGSSLFYDDGSLMHGGMYFEADAGFHASVGGVTRRTMARVEHYGKGAPPWATQYVASRPVPAVTGAFLSVDRAWYEKLGGFSDDYIYGHYEDADLCLKSLFAGTPAWLHDIRMWHLEDKSSRRPPQHEGGSLVNRWNFSRTWIPKIVPDVLGRTPQHRLLGESAVTPQHVPGPAREHAPGGEVRVDTPAVPAKPHGAKTAPGEAREDARAAGPAIPAKPHGAKRAAPPAAKSPSPRADPTRSRAR